MPFRFLLKIMACTLLCLAGCATVTQDEAKLWQTKPIQGEGGHLTQVLFIGGKTPLTARAASFYKDYHIIPRSQYAKYHVPADAKSAFSGSQHVDHDVVYVVETPGQWRVYGYTFGLYDIDFPPKEIGTLTR